LCTTVPVGVFWYLIKTDKERQADPTVLPILKGFSYLVTEHALAVILLAYVYLFICQLVLETIRKYAKPLVALDRDDFVMYEETLSTVLGTKRSRFRDYVHEQRQFPRIDPGVTFLAITKPLDQIRLLTVAIHIMLSYLDRKYKKGDADFRVGLVKINAGTPIQWLEYIGGSGSPSLSPEELASKDSALMQCLSTREPVVILDIAKERKKSQKRSYTSVSEEVATEGSLVCYPVKYNTQSSNDIPYVITIKTDIKNNFEPYGLYKWAIDLFVNRMVLEHSLVILREKADGRRDEG